MKLSKKILSAVCAMAMAGCVGTTAFAASSGTGSSTFSGMFGSTYSKDLTVGIEATITPAPTLYNVNIAWETLEFDYLETGRKWNTSTHQDDPGEGQWNEGDASSDITITNNSNKKVDVKAEYNPQNGYDGSLAGNTYTTTPKNNVTITATGDILASAKSLDVYTGDGNTAKTTINVAVSGTPTENIVAVDVGAITISLGTENSLTTP